MTYETTVLTVHWYIKICILYQTIVHLFYLLALTEICSA